MISGLMSEMQEGRMSEENNEQKKKKRKEWTCGKSKQTLMV